MKTLWIICSALLGSPLFADYVAYGGRHFIETSQNALRVVHRHDWDPDKIADLFLDLLHHEEFLGDKNDFSYIEASDISGNVVFRRPSSALTTLWISPDSKYIVGLSTVMLYNPYQIMVWKADGTLIYKEHISDSVAKLSASDFELFNEKFPTSAAYLSNRVKRHADAVYIDYAILGIPNNIDPKAWDFLSDHSSPNPYSDDFISSISNRIYWYDAKTPNLQIVNNQGQVTITLSSLTGKPIRIIAREE